MTNSVSIIRALFIYGLCLPLAVYLGYLLALPLDRNNLLVLAVAVLFPLLPVLLRWHHALLIASWNMSVVLFFLPGSPPLWIFMTAVSVGLTILQHVLKRDVQIVSVPSVSNPLFFLAIVVVVTAELTGGFGMRSFGGEAYGGKRYVTILAAIAGYFALTSHRVPPGRAVVYVALYFLGTLTMIIGSLAPWMPSGLRYLYALFPSESLTNFSGGGIGENIRLCGVTVAMAGVVNFILARHGMRGLFAVGERWCYLPLRFKGGFGVNQPWRLLGFLATVWIGLLGGYRSTPILLLIMFFFLFCFEGLYRTRLFPTFVLFGILVVTISVPLVEKMPLMVQRSLSFLPIAVNPLAQQDAQASAEWRLKIWREVIPTIPQYLLIGKGYSIDARELEAAKSISDYSRDDLTTTTTMASDFHSGPLSLLIPMGAFGTIAFLWFLVAGFRVLHGNYRYGDPQFRQLNTFLLVSFLTAAVFFFFVFGSFQNELMVFTGLVGLSIAINGEARQPAKAPAAPNPAYLPFRLPKTVRA